MMATYVRTMSIPPHHPHQLSNPISPEEAFWPPSTVPSQTQPYPIQQYQSFYPQHAALEFPSPSSPHNLPPQHILQYLPSRTSHAPYSPHRPANSHSTYTPHFSQPRSRPCPSGGRAVLIGINYFNQKGEMTARVDEARNLHSYLIRCKHYRPEDIILLTDDQNGVFGQPTREHIIKALTWLSAKAYQDEKIVVYYSGHGKMGVKGKKRSSSDKGKGSVAVVGGDEEGETMYPVDFRCFREGTIRPEVTEDLLEPARRKGAKLTIIMDTHGGVV